MITALVSSYGYAAVFVGTLLEGETVLIAAGFAANRGMLRIEGVMLAAMAGGMLGDLLAFGLGRWRGAGLIARLPSLASRRARVNALIERHALLFIVFLRFMYGLRLAGPVLLGTTGLPILRFALFNAVGAVIWAVAVGGAGYLFGATIESLLGDLRHLEEAIVLAILLAGTAVLLWRTLRDHDRH